MTESEYHDIAKYGVIELAGKFLPLCFMILFAYSNDVFIIDW